MKIHFQWAVETYLGPFQGSRSQGHGRILFCSSDSCHEVFVATLKFSDINDTGPQATVGSSEVGNIGSKTNCKHMKKQHMILKGRTPVGFNRPVEKHDSVHFLMACFGINTHQSLYIRGPVCPEPPGCKCIIGLKTSKVHPLNKITVSTDSCLRPHHQVKQSMF